MTTVVKEASGNHICVSSEHCFKGILLWSELLLRVVHSTGDGEVKGTTSLNALSGIWKEEMVEAAPWGKSLGQPLAFMWSGKRTSLLHFHRANFCNNLPYILSYLEICLVLYRHDKRQNFSPLLSSWSLSFDCWIFASFPFFFAPYCCFVTSSFPRLF